MAKSKSKSPRSRRKATSTTSVSPQAEIIGSSPPKQPAVKMTREERFKKRFNTAKNSLEVIRDLQVANWSSRVYEHFVMPPKICDLGPDEDGSDRIGYRFFCKLHPTVSLRRDRLDDSTSNLARHVQTCDPEASAEMEAMEAFANGSTLSTGRLRFLLVKWITKNYRPFSIIEDEELQEIMQMLDCRVQIPSRSTLSRDVRELFGVTRLQVQSFFKQYQGKVHIGLDGWTSPNVFSYLGITVHYIHGCEMKTVILDFVKLTAAHDSAYLAEKLHECLVEYHLDTKLLGVVCDNASNNGTMINALGKKIPSWGGSTMRVRCFAHILNLVVKSILSVFTIKRKRTADGTETYEDPHLADLLQEISDRVDEEDDNAFCEDENDGRNAADEMLINEMEQLETEKREVSASAKEVRVAQVTIEKLKSLAKSIFHSPTLRASLQEQCALTEPVTPYRMLVRPVATRWNSLTMTIKSALALRPALSLLIDLNVHNKNKATRLRRFTLDDEEWRILQELLPLLDRFLEATNIISASNFPLIHSVIPLIDQLSNTLESWMNNTELHPAVQIASRRGWDLLNKYYGLTDDSVVYRIAMIMHPRRKLTYFRSAGWPEEWIKTSVDLARSQWVNNYRPNASSVSTNDAEDSPKTSSYFQDVENFNGKGVDAFENYIATPVVSIACPIMYWVTLQQSGDALATMALDFLTCPAASTDVERAFSRGRLTVSRTRHSLSDESTRASTVLSSWFQHAHFIPETNLVELFGNKNARPQNGRVGESDLEVNGGTVDLTNSMVIDNVVGV